jgi:hypothetical protein
VLEIKIDASEVVKKGCPSHGLCICCGTNNRVQSEMSQVFCNLENAMPMDRIVIDRE